MRNIRTDRQTKAELFKEHFIDHICIYSIHAATPLCPLVRVNWHLCDWCCRLLPYVGTWSEFCPNFRSCWYFLLDWLYMLRAVMWDCSEHSFQLYLAECNFYSGKRRVILLCGGPDGLISECVYEAVYFRFNTHQDFKSISGNEKMTIFSTGLVTTVELGDEKIELRK